MDKYIGVKLIEAQPMTSEQFNEQVRPLYYSGDDNSGYKVVYPDGYESWSPKGVFEEAYRHIDNMTFGLAVEALKKGYRVARAGWNGKGMWLRLVIPGGANLPYIEMKTVDDKLVPWLSSQTDVLAEDWIIVE